MATGHSQVVNTLGVVASRAAYEESGNWLDAVVSYVDQNMRYLENYLSKHVPLINFKRPEGTYLAWLDFSDWMEKIGAKLTVLSEDQADYINVPVNGPYKKEEYRY